MVEPINLNQVRKARAKQQAKSKAAENRVMFGRPKAVTLRDQLEAERARRALEDKKRGD